MLAPRLTVITIRHVGRPVVYTRGGPSSPFFRLAGRLTFESMGRWSHGEGLMDYWISAVLSRESQGAGFGLVACQPVKPSI